MFWLSRFNFSCKELVYVRHSIEFHIDLRFDFLFLVSGLPLEAGLAGLGRLSRSMSMEEADRPRRSSVLNSSSPGTASPPLVGSPPK